jgi:hypothetical protein
MPAVSKAGNQVTWNHFLFLGARGMAVGLSPANTTIPDSNSFDWQVQ